MNKFNTFFILTIIFLVFSSCSKDDSPTTDFPVVYRSLTVSNTYSFIENSITLNIDGEEYTQISIATTSPDIIITNVNPTTYNVAATKAIEITIKVVLENDNYSEEKNMNLSFFEHGIKDFRVVEGISIDVDKADKVLELLGKPDDKEDASGGNNEFWYYFSKGFSLLINKETTIVDDSRIYGRAWNRTVNDMVYQGSIYPYQIGNNWNFSTNTVIMDDVITKLGQPNSKNENTTNTLKWYIYNSVVFFFFSDSVDDYTGKEVPYINVF